jgi:hypothetical protein
MADFCTITTEQAERAGAIEFLAAQLLHEVDRVLNNGPMLNLGMRRDLTFAADMLRAKKPRGIAARVDPTNSNAGGA